MNNKKNALLKMNDPNMPTMDVNERFIDACINGDYQSVNYILDSIKDFNIDITDNLGRTALRLAVANEHIEVVQALLAKSDTQKLREALLVAIYMGHTTIAEAILKHPKYKVFNDKKFLNSATDSFWQTPSSDDTQFSPDITPIMLASQYNRTEIVQMLLSNGDRIEKPHEFYCTCNECSNRFKFDSLRHAQSRLNAYRGIASESYISLASIDPILTAFELGHEIKILAEKEKYFKSEYLKLAENLSEYTVKLLSYVRGKDELETFLNKTGKENEEKFELLARLDLAIKYREMPFVAHPNCQQKLVEIWHHGIQRITKMNPILYLIALSGIVFYLPIGTIFYIFNPKSKFSTLMYQPFVKFITFSSSYVILVFIVIYSSLDFPNDEINRQRFSKIYPDCYKNFTTYASNSNLTYYFPVNDFFMRRGMPSMSDIVLCIWLAGLITNEIKLIYRYGFKEYFYSWSNMFNASMYILFAASLSLKFYTMIIVTIGTNQLSDPSFWSQVNNLQNSNDLNAEINIYQVFYWLNDDRYFWYSYDPINLSEGLFAFATVLTFSRLVFFLPAFQSLGPLYITFGRMISDILKFICIFLILFFGFLFGLNNLYWYYQYSVRSSVEIIPHYKTKSNQTANQTTINAEIYFGTIDRTFRTMFWSIYLIGNSEVINIEPFKNDLMLVFGYLIFALYHVINITIMINMLIAMMARSYDSILHHSDTEWKFARSKLYMEFIREGATLPVPLNILPMPALILKFIRTIFYCVLRKKNNRQPNEIEMPQFNRNNVGNGKAQNGAVPHKSNGVNKESSGSSELTYRKVMERVIKRFLLHNNRENEDIRESDFDELKQDVQIVRFEMLNYLRQNKEDAAKYTSILHNGLLTLGDFVCSSMQNSEIEEGFKDYQKFEKNLEQELDHYQDPNKLFISFTKGFTITSKHEDYGARKKSSTLSFKLEENVKCISEDDNALDENGNKTETEENRINNEAINKLSKQGYLDLNEINEEN